MNKFILIAILAIASCIEYKDEEEAFELFQNFIIKYGKKYTNMREYQKRYKIFHQNLDRNSMAKGRWQEGITKFFDLTPAEFKAMYLNYRPKTQAKVHLAAPSRLQKAPQAYDWREQGIVPPVKDQASCGSCWAFSTCGCVESQYKKKFDKWETCSEQMLVDCDEEDLGCDGGFEVEAAGWIGQNGGIENEDTYPYLAYDDDCHANPKNYKITVNEVVQMEGSSEDDMVEFLYEHGPCMIAQNADPLQFYEGGIIDVDEEECDPESIDHALVMVGYGVKGSKPYWIVRNSWGEDWGEEGYYRIIRGKGACGINLELAYAEVDKV